MVSSVPDKAMEMSSRPEHQDRAWAPAGQDDEPAVHTLTSNCASLRDFASICRPPPRPALTAPGSNMHETGLALAAGAARVEL